MKFTLVGGPLHGSEYDCPEPSGEVLSATFPISPPDDEYPHGYTYIFRKARDGTEFLGWNQVGPIEAELFFDSIRSAGPGKP